LGAYANGLASVLKAKQMAEESGNTRLVREALVIAADLQTFLGHYENGLQNVELALEMDRKDGFREKTIEDLLCLANIKLYLGRASEGRSALEEIRALTAELGRADLEWVVFFGIGHSYEKENPDSACAYYEKAFERIERVGAGLGGQEIRSGFFSNERRRYFEEVMRFYASQAVDAERELWSSRAFQTIERAKSRGLLELMEQSVKQDVSREEDALLDSLYALRALSSIETDAQRRIESRYVELRESRFERQLGELDARERIARIDVVQEALPKQTVLLEYALGDTASYLWCIDSERQQLFELPDRKVLRQKVTGLRDAVAKPGSGDAALKRLSRDLYAILIEPAEKMLSGSRTLILIPDGVLFELPFEILLSKDPQEAESWGDLHWLTRSFETLYLPSASIFVELQSAPLPEHFDHELVAVGNPDYSTLEVKSELKMNVIAPLPHTKNEVETICSFLPDDKRIMLLGAQASETALKQRLHDGTQRILHLATHGYADPVEPIVSSVLLCREQGSNDDGYLHTLEILSLPIRSNLVVLSACESARGRLSRGEGVVGLSRAFFAAGAKSVIASLWSVSDNSTSELMKQFYESMIVDRQTARRALRQARLELLKDETFAHPFYWSPFIVIGRPDSPWSR
jgi:CHAT domain-containing protein